MSFIEPITSSAQLKEELSELEDTFEQSIRSGLVYPTLFDANILNNTLTKILSEMVIHIELDFHSDFVYSVSPHSRNFNISKKELSSSYLSLFKFRENLTYYRQTLYDIERDIFYKLELNALPNPITKEVFLTEHPILVVPNDDKGITRYDVFKARIKQRHAKNLRGLIHAGSYSSHEEALDAFKPGLFITSGHVFGTYPLTTIIEVKGSENYSFKSALEGPLSAKLKYYYTENVFPSLRLSH